MFYEAFSKYISKKVLIYNFVSKPISKKLFFHAIIYDFCQERSTG